MLSQLVANACALGVLPVQISANSVGDTTASLGVAFFSSVGTTASPLVSKSGRLTWAHRNVMTGTRQPATYNAFLCNYAIIFSLKQLTFSSENFCYEALAGTL